MTLERCLTLCNLLSSVKRIKKSKKGGTIARCRSQRLPYVVRSPLVRRTHKKSRSKVERSRGVTLKGCFMLCDLLSSVKIKSRSKVERSRGVTLDRYVYLMVCDLLSPVKKKVEARLNNLLVTLERYLTVCDLLSPVKRIKITPV